MKKKDIIQLVKKLVKEDAYGSATLTTQGSPRTGTVVPTDEYPFSKRPKRTATGMMEELELGVKYERPNGDTGYIMTGGSDDPRNWKFSGNSYLSVKDELKPLSTQPGKYDGAFDLGLGKGHHIDEFNLNEEPNLEIHDLLITMDKTKAGPEYKKALMALIAMAEKKSGKTINTKAEALSALDYTTPETFKRKQSSQFENEETPSVKIGDILHKGNKEGKVVKVMSDMANVDFGNGDVYGITFARIKGDQITEKIKNKMKKSELKEMIKAAMLAETSVEETLVDADQDMAEAILNALGGEAAFEAVVRAMSTDDAQIYLGAIMRDHDIEMGPVGDIPGFEGTMDALDSLSLREEEEKLKEDITDDISKAEDAVATATQAKADAEVKVADARKKKADAEKGALEEMDDEGRMAKSQMYKMQGYVSKLSSMLDDGAQLPAWVQSKLTKASDYMSAVFHYLEYEAVRGQDNLMEHVDKYKKRALLMEGAMKKFFEMFDMGKTDEEIIQDYAQRGTQVPEAFVNKARKQYEGLKKMKLELEMSEKEYKNSATQIVNNPATNEMDGSTTMETKKLSTDLFNEGLDPVGKEDDDVNNDGKVDKTDKYLKNKRKAVSKAINKK